MNAQNIQKLNCSNLTRIKNFFFAVTTTVRDVLSAYPDTIIIPSSSRYKGNTHEVSSYDNDGIVLLYYAILSKSPRSYEMQFDFDFEKKIKKVKNNTIKKGADHNGSVGLYYSFGNKGAYEMVNNSSVGQYKCKIIKDNEVSTELKSWCGDAENLIAEHLNESVTVLKSYIRNIPKLISPVIDVAYKMQSEHADVNLKATKGIDNGIWMATIAINAQTTKFHSENDVTYTLVTVPKQCIKMNKGNRLQRIFLIYLNDNNIFPGHLI